MCRGVGRSRYRELLMELDPRPPLIQLCLCSDQASNNPRRRNQHSPIFALTWASLEPRRLGWAGPGSSIYYISSQKVRLLDPGEPRLAVLHLFSPTLRV